jgi:leucyl aminopeptidase
MKYDKCGGMAVIGAMHAIARLKLPMRVVGLIPAAENMVDERAYRPNDILTMTNGVTVEVTNTDAEGRLILADALAYGCQHYKPRAVIDLATLTGGVVVALGSACAGAFVNDADLRTHLFDAAEASGERLWHLPLWDEHKKLIKGTHSDIVNSAAVREAHPIQGAAFLSYFVAKDGDFKKKDPVPWAHLDIAGVVEAKGNNGSPLPKGPTGFGVRLLVRAIESWK